MGRKQTGCMTQLQDFSNQRNQVSIFDHESVCPVWFLKVGMEYYLLG